MEKALWKDYDQVTWRVQECTILQKKILGCHPPTADKNSLQKWEGAFTCPKPLENSRKA